MNELEVKEYQEILNKIKRCKEDGCWVSILIGNKFTPSGFILTIKNGWITIGDESRNVMVHIRSIKTITIMDN